MCLTMYSTLDRGEGALGSDSKYSRTADTHGQQTQTLLPIVTQVKKMFSRLKE